MRRRSVPSVVPCAAVLLFFASHAIWAQVKIGEVAGVVTYRVQLSGGGSVTRPDVGAKVYFLKVNSGCQSWRAGQTGDTDDRFLVRFMLIGITHALKVDIANLDGSPVFPLSDDIQTRAEFDSLVARADAILHKLRLNPKTRSATADASGHYGAKLKVGTYVAVFVSAHIQHPNKAEEGGAINMRCFEVTEGESADASCSFFL